MVMTATVLIEELSLFMASASFMLADVRPILVLASSWVKRANI
jgi:hypothetical protein